MADARDVAVVRLALRAGGVVWAVVAGLLLSVVLLGGHGGRAGLAAVLSGLVAGAAVTSGWLLLAGVLDLLADVPVGRRRLAWTAGAVLLTLASPILVLGAAGGG